MSDITGGWSRITNTVRIPYDFWQRLKWLCNRQQLVFTFSVNVKPPRGSAIDHGVQETLIDSPAITGGVDTAPKAARR